MINKGDYVRDMAGNISKVECIIDYKRTPSIPYLTSKGVIILTNDIYLDSDIIVLGDNIVVEGAGVVEITDKDSIQIKVSNNEIEKEYTINLKRKDQSQTEEVVTVDEKTPDNASEAQNHQIMEKEGDRILAKISERDYVIVLAIITLLSRQEIKQVMQIVKNKLKERKRTS